MKKIIKTGLLAFTVILVLMFTSEVEAKVVDITVDDNIVGTIDPNSRLVTNIEQLNFDNFTSKGEEIFKAYKIMDVFFNREANSMTYEFTTDFKNFLKTTEEFKSLTEDEYQKLPAEKFQKLVSFYAIYVKGNAIDGIDIVKEENKGYTYKKMQLGSYLFLPYSATQVYEPMVGSIVFEEKNGNWESPGYSHSLVKVKSSNVQLNKFLLKKGKTNNRESLYINEETTYQIRINIPQYPVQATNKKFTLKDNATKGITFKELLSIKEGYGTDAVSLNITSDGRVLDPNNNEVATFTIKDQELTIGFNTDYITASTIYIEYKAELNQNAELGLQNVSGNPKSPKIWYVGKNINTATLTYSTDPYGTETKTIEEKVYIDTFGLEVFVHEIDEISKPLKGIEFDIYEDKECTKKVGRTTPTDENGIAYYKGLSVDAKTDERNHIYYLKQAKASTGYQLNKEVIPVIIGYDIVTGGHSPVNSCLSLSTILPDDSTDTPPAASTASSAASTVSSAALIALSDDSDSSDSSDTEPTVTCTTIGELPGYYKVEIANQKWGLLPMTGSIGTIIFVVLGLGLVSVSSYCIIRYKKNGLKA